MFSAVAFSSLQLGRFLFGAPLVVALLLGAASVQAQVAPTPAPAQKPMPKNVAYYVDGQKAGSDALAKISPSDISNINVIKGADQQQLFGAANADGTVVITTKAGENLPAVMAFNNRINAVKPIVPPTPEQVAGMEAAKAYLLKTYPSAKLEMVGPARDKPGYYHAVFTEGGKRQQLLFDGQGQPVKQ